ncbi:MAG: NADH-quinone oxidoreductase subunit NuoK [Anaerolineae bacterium]
MVPLWMYLVVAAILFALGLFGVLSRRNAVAILMGVELMLNAVNINLLAFWRYRAPETIIGQAFAVFVFVVAAAEAAVGLALIVAVYRRKQSVAVEDVNLLKW